MSSVKQMKMRGMVELNNDHSMTFFGELYDGQPFDLRVGQWDVELNEEFRPSKLRVEGFLFVQQEAQRGDVVYLTLPKPTMRHGKQVSVRETTLMPRNVTIEDFGAQKKTLANETPDVAEKPSDKS